MSTVTLRHPTLPDTQTITVPEQAAPRHREAGWVPVEDQQPAVSEPDTGAGAKTDSKPSPARATAADAASESVPDTAPRRRATKEAEQQ